VSENPELKRIASDVEQIRKIVSRIGLYIAIWFILSLLAGCGVLFLGGL